MLLSEQEQLFEDLRELVHQCVTAVGSAWKNR
jgi:hypothetical protein